MKKVLLLFIVAFAFSLRLYGINWDQNQHLHPDERFLTMVVAAEKIPRNFSEYLDPVRSPLNPRNVGFGFFVYGTLPLTLVKLLTVKLSLDNYNAIAIVGRVMSAAFDMGTLMFVYLVASLWEKRYSLASSYKYIATFLYGITVLAIQHAHFFIVDTPLVFFSTGAYYFALRISSRLQVRYFFLCAVFFGMALASKLSAIYLLPLILTLVVMGVWAEKRSQRRGIVSIGVICFLCVAYLTLRVTDPYFFSDSNFFNVHPNPQLFHNASQLKSFNTPDAWYPPGVQWIDKKPILHALTNIIFFGLGLPYGILVVIGVFKLMQTKMRTVGISLLWVLLFFIYQSSDYVKSIRYFYPLYPFFALFAGYAVAYVWERNKKRTRFLVASFFVGILLWPLAFMNIYTSPHSRVDASEWIFNHIPHGALIASEHWDDGLPLSLNGKSASEYTNEQLPVFDPDTKEKWDKIRAILDRADYIILSSNRGYGSIMPVPTKYPQMSLWYRDLFAGRLEFGLVKEFESYPAICIGGSSRCISFPDQWSDEPFTVYDHPKVMIFKKLYHQQ